MSDNFDILEKLPDGGLVWIEAEEDLETTRERVKHLASRKPGEYVIFSRLTQSFVRGPWMSFTREMGEVAASAGGRRKKAKREKKIAPSDATTQQVIADIVADIVRRVRPKEPDV